MDAPQTRYAKAGDCHIAYQAVGEGPIDLVYVPTWISHIEVLWEEPHVAAFFERLSSFARLIMFDRRGSGLSDPLIGVPTLEQQMDDVTAVLDAVGSREAAIFAQLEGGPMATLFAATHPERTRGLALFSTFARAVWSEDIPWADHPDVRDERFETFLSEWGSGSRLGAFCPSIAGNERVVRWFGKVERYSASPTTIRGITELIGQTDVRCVLPTISVPTLVMYRRDDPVMNPLHSHYLAERIPDTKLVEFPPGDTLPMFDANDRLADELEEFFTGSRAEREPDRILATVMFTDICDSTTRAAELGDSRWRALLEEHNRLLRAEVERNRGRVVKHMGDGLLATFDGPARGIRCAVSAHEAVSDLGIRLRAGLHTGECEVMGDDVGGLAVHIGARVGATAKPGETLVSSTVKDLVVGSGLEFADRGAHELKGVPGEWRLFAVTD